MDLENKELENYNNKLKIYKEMKESGILDDEVQNYLEELQKYGANLLMGNDES